MKRLIGISLMLLIGVVTTMSFVDKDDAGIEFKHMTLEKAKRASAKSGKLIFIDCYTNWCGPCKKMAKTTFHNEEVGKIFNKNFINLKVEMEKDADGPDLARKYRVNAYPTLLIIDSKGKLIKSAIGYHSVDRLKSLANSVL